MLSFERVQNIRKLNLVVRTVTIRLPTFKSGRNCVTTSIDHHISFVLLLHCTPREDQIAWNESAFGLYHYSA